MRDLAAVFKALSDETRVKMMALLLDNDELCVCDFVGALELTQSKASRHLRYLYNAGLVRDRRDGLWMHYRLAPDLSPSRQALVDALRRMLTDEQRDDLRVRLTAWLTERKC